MNIGKVIRQLRKEKGMTQGVFAEKIGVTPQYLSLVEINKKSPSTDLIEKMAKELGFPTYYLFFKGMELEDVAPEKREAYEKLSPAISGMLEQFFLGK